MKYQVFNIFIKFIKQLQLYIMAIAMCITSELNSPYYEVNYFLPLKPSHRILYLLKILNLILRRIPN